MSWALLVIDLQNGYFQTPALAAVRDRVLEHANQLIDTFDQQSLPVFQIITTHQSDRSTWTRRMHTGGADYMVAGSQEVLPLPGLAAAPHHRRITKTRDSAFFGTDLQHQLEEQGIEKLVVLGVSSHACVALTALDAYARDYHVVIAQEATAGSNAYAQAFMLELLQSEYSQDILSTEDIIMLVSGPVIPADQPQLPIEEPQAEQPDISSAQSETEIPPEQNPHSDQESPAPGNQPDKKWFN